MTIRHSALGITAKAKVITTVYDTLAEKYVSVTLGSGKANLLNNVSDAKAGAEEAAEKAGHFPALMNSPMDFSPLAVWLVIDILMQLLRMLQRAL